MVSVTQSRSYPEFYLFPASDYMVDGLATAHLTAADIESPTPRYHHLQGIFKFDLIFLPIFIKLSLFL